jgi:hypothetical protein
MMVQCVSRPHLSLVCASAMHVIFRATSGPLLHRLLIIRAPPGSHLVAQDGKATRCPTAGLDSERLLPRRPPLRAGRHCRSLLAAQRTERRCVPRCPPQRPFAPHVPALTSRLPGCTGIGLLAYGALAGGTLSGKYHDGARPTLRPNLALVAAGRAPAARGLRCTPRSDALAD